MAATVSEYEDDEWPDLGRFQPGVPYQNGNATEAIPPLRRYVERKQTDSLFYNMASVLAAVGAGFDVRLSNSSAIHPNMQPATESEGESTPVQRRSHIGRRRDAYMAAVRDSLLEPPVNFEDLPHPTNHTGYPHNTYHGHQTKYRPSVNFEVPMRFTESMYDCYTADGYADNVVTPVSGDSRTTPSISGASFSGGTPSPSPRKASIDPGDLALISLSPSQDRSFIERQMSDTSGSVFDTPVSTPKTTPMRHSVKFEDGYGTSPAVHMSHRRSPSNTSASSSATQDYGVRGTSDSDYETHYSPTPSAILPPPPSYAGNADSELNSANSCPAERPMSLDIKPRPRPMGILKRPSPSPQHFYASRSSPRSKYTPTPADSAIGGDDSISGRLGSGPSPGSTPPHIDHVKTLLDIDMEGQREDSTQPLPLVIKTKTQPSISDLEKEFL